MLETIAVVVGIASTCLGIFVGASSTAARAFWRLEKRLEAIDDAITKTEHDRQLERQSLEARIEMIEYLNNANKELIEHRSRRLEGAIASLAGGLEKYSGGQFVNRSPGWPTDDPPTSIKRKATR